VAWFRRMGADEVDYHRHTVMHRGDDHPGAALAYYGSRGETPLEWGGQLADRLGLVGVVDDAGYEAIFGPGGARDPHRGTRLTATRRPGVELVVAAHKTVAILGLMGRADDMHAILDAETDATMAFLEEWFARQGGRRGRGQTRTATGGLLWARTRHATSRAGDPAPHDHVLVANLTEMLDGDGGWKALDTAGLRDLTHAATMVGRLAAAERAVELGYAIEADPGPSGRLDHWAIAGIPRDVTELFSKRSDEIDAAIETTGFTSYQARGVAARETRRAKRPETQDALVVRWLDELDGIGWPARKLNQRFRILQDRQRQPLRSLSAQQRAAMVDALIGPDGPLAERKAFTRADVIRLAAPRLYGYAAGELDRVVDALTRHPEAIPLVGEPAARSRAWAAASALATEAAVAEVAERMAHRQGAPSVPAAVIDHALAAKQARLAGPLTAGQITAARAVATSGRGLDLVVGVAGSGKTTVLEAVRQAFETAGHTVVGTATSGQAARTLAEAAGIQSHTLASLRWRLARGPVTLDARTAVVLDEAGMTDDPDLLAVLAAADAARAKIVAVGDHRQLGAVGPGGGLEALITRHPTAVHTLDQNIRQRDPAERAALGHLRAGNTDSAVKWYLNNGRVHVAATRDQALDQAVDGWFADQHCGANTLLLAWQRANVAALNQRARTRWAAAGRLQGPEIAIAGRRYAAGDRILALAPHHPAGVVTSQRGTITAVDDHGLSARMDNGQTVRFTGDALAADRLEYSYAATINRTQGATANTGRILWDGGGREIAYVALSRTTGPTHIHVVADDVDQAAEDLRRDWASEGRQQWVLDTDSPAPPGTGRHPYLHRRTEPVLRAARLLAERAALLADLPPDPTGTLRHAQQQAATIRHQLDDLHAGTGPHAHTPIGEAARRLRTTEHNHQQARQQTAGPGLSRRQHRSAERLAQAWAEELADARYQWSTVAGSTERLLLDALDDAENASARLGAQRALQALDRARGHGIHARIAAIDRELESIDAGLPNAPAANRPVEISRGLGLSL
jgi:conjugative relaxase-like TrwC/TraI family protein